MGSKRVIKELRDQGIPLFPCCPGTKKPLTPNGYKDATTDKAQIRAWWESWPDAMLGMPTGTVTGLWVLDVDIAKDEESEGGDASLAELIAKHAPLPSTRTHATPSGGKHLLFKYPVGGEVRNSASKIAPGLDVRGEGGYIIIPPSVNSGGGQYVTVDDCEPVEAPEWLLDLVTGKKPPTVRETTKSVARLAKKTTLDKKLEELATATPGTRNTALASISYYCGNQIAAGALSEEMARRRLVDACEQNGLWNEERDKTEQTITSSLDKGMEGDGRPTIIWAEAQQHEVILQVVEIIAGLEPPRIYRQATGFVYVGQAESAQPTGLQIYPFSWRTLQTVLTALICWKKLNAKGELVGTKCPSIVAENLLEMRGALHKLPYLEGITNMPIMRRDGSISITPGYDAETGLYFDPGDNDWPKVLNKPTLRNAKRAYGAFRELLKDFPFQEYHHRSVAVSMILTAITRHLFGTSPFFGLSSRMAGTGKTLLARIMAILATGHDVSAMPLPRQEEELQKVITTVLRKRQPILLFDNISRPLGGDTLCTLLTSESFQGRLLGTNTAPHFSTRVTLVATGINLRINGDLSRRCLLCEMDAGIEHPEEREFERDIIAYTRESRVKLLTAAFTMLRAFSQAEDKPKLSAFGSFEEWSSLVRGCLVWIGLSDPLKSQQDIRSDDPAREALGAVLRAWRRVGRTQDSNEDCFMTVKSALKNEALKETLDAAIPHGAGGLTAQHVGQWLSANKGNIVNGFFFEKAGDRKQAKWRVAKIKE